MPGAVAALLGERKAWDGVWLFPATAAADDDEGDGAPRPNASPLSTPQGLSPLGVVQGGGIEAPCSPSPRLHQWAGAADAHGCASISAHGCALMIRGGAGVAAPPPVRAKRKASLKELAKWIKKSAGIAFDAKAQNLPEGTYKDSCKGARRGMHVHAGGAYRGVDATL
jgi:hypothetical protein